MKIIFITDGDPTAPGSLMKVIFNNSAVTEVTLVAERAACRSASYARLTADRMPWATFGRGGCDALRSWQCLGFHTLHGGIPYARRRQSARRRIPLRAGVFSSLGAGTAME